jgi:GT2 family glycosyltransferase
MISIIVPARNGRLLTGNCLNSLEFTSQQLGGEHEIEYILIDDNSDPEHHIPYLFQIFRKKMNAPVTIVRFKERRQYAWSCAYGFARAKGSAILFLSFDMAITPDYFRSILQVAGLDEKFGIVRGTSQYIDGFPQYQIEPPLPTRNMIDLANFSAYISRYYGLAHSQDQFLTGDAMLIKRSVFDKIGSFDTRFPFGYFSDLDFGLRAKRAGFQIVCAKGAWLHHVGGGSYKDESDSKKIDFKLVMAERQKEVMACYRYFRDKWDQSLLPEYEGGAKIPFAKLLALPPASFDEFQPFAPLEDPLVEIL